MDVVAIDRAKNVRKMVLLTHEEVRDLTAYRRAQETIPTESAAIAELLRWALAAWREEDEREGKKR